VSADGIGVDEASTTPGVLDRFCLDGKVVVVTGASSGLGVAFAVAFAQAGADVVICSRRLDRLKETATLVEAQGRRCMPLTVDVTRPEERDALARDAIGTFGRLDVLVNTAGVGHAVPATREIPAQFRRVMDVNVCGSFWMAQACARVMGGGGSIINVGSILGSTTAELPQAAYCASKAALIGLTRDLAQEWSGRKGIRVNTLAPGFFPSEMTDRYEEGYLDDMMRRVPAGRIGDPRELAAAAIFLASDAASYITGILLPVDGGLLTR
jgi:NAD(P)-dependent dehydrogenase (short-subunit alcohol dehydrogenase family)